MLKNMKKKLIFLFIIVIIILILFGVAIINITTKNNIKEDKKTEISNEILFEPYKLENNILTMLIKFQNEDGINNIQDIKNRKTLNCYGKTAISIDYKITYDEDGIYSFILEKTNGEKIQKDLIIDNSFRDSIIGTNIEFEDDDYYFDIEISKKDNNKYYYKFSKMKNGKNIKEDLLKLHMQ